MGESKNGPLRLDFERQLKLEFHSSTVTGDADLLARLSASKDAFASDSDAQTRADANGDGTSI